MNVQGIFYIKKAKDEALVMFDNLVAKYKSKRYIGIQQELAVCKAICYDAIQIIMACFEYNMWGPKRCIKRLQHLQGNDEIRKTKDVISEVDYILLELRYIIESSVPFEELPSCKHLTELSTSDAISAINDLGKNSIVKAVVCAGLLGKNISDSIEISDVEKYYIRQIEELERELAEEHREMCNIEVFLMAKYQAELGYCHQARVKTGIGTVKEIVGIINNASEAIRKYEGMVAPKNTPSLTYK